MNKVLLVVFFCFQSSQLKEITSKDVSEDKKVKELLADGYELDSISAPSLENDGLNMRLAVSVTLKKAEIDSIDKLLEELKPARDFVLSAIEEMKEARAAQKEYQVKVDAGEVKRPEDFATPIVDDAPKKPAAKKATTKKPAPKKPATKKEEPKK